MSQPTTFLFGLTEMVACSYLSKIYSILRTWSYLLCRASLSILKSFITFTIQSKPDQNLDFDYICSTQQTYSILRIWSYLLCRASLSIPKSLITFTTPTKPDQNLDFDYICLSEQTYSILRIWSYLLYRANFINTVSLITFADPSKHFKFSLLSTFATL